MRFSILLAAVLSLSTAQATDSSQVAHANEIDRSFETMGAVLVDDLAVASIQELVRRLSLTKHYTIRLLRHPSANAFAMPNNAIYLHTGLLLRVVTETELAALLAHELAHSELGHFDRSSESVNRFNHSRSIEDEVAADTRAIAILSEAGYCPSVAADFFRRLRRERTETRRDADFSTSHPSLGDRVARWEGSQCETTTPMNPVIPSFDVFRKARLDALTQLALQQRGETIVYLSSIDSVRNGLGIDGTYFWAEGLRLRNEPDDQLLAVGYWEKATASTTYGDSAYFRLAQTAMWQGDWQDAHHRLRAVDSRNLPPVLFGFYGPLVQQVDNALRPSTLDE